MTLEKISANNTISLEIINGENRQTISTRLIGSNTDGAILAPAYSNNQLILLNSKTSRNTIFNMYCIDENNDRRVWRGVNVTTLIRNGINLYAVAVNKFNRYGSLGDRRYDRRYSINRAGLITPKNGRKTEIAIHDISDSGISFYAPKDYVQTTPTLIVYFDDQVRGHYFRLGVPCSAVRTVDADGRVLHGCKITAKDKNLMEYLSLKKMEYQAAARA